MLLDNLSRFCDDAGVATTAANSNALQLSNYAGRDEPIYILAQLTGTNAAASTLTINFQESADNSTFTTLATWTLVKPINALVTETFLVPPTTTKKYVRLNYAVGAAATGVRFSAGIVAERHLPYGPGQYIDKGQVIA
jgi:hypothetical protein